MIGYNLNELYIGDLDPNVTEEILFNAFSRFGQIFSLKVMRHIVTGVSRGFAFVNYVSPGYAMRAKTEMNAQKFFGKILRVYLKSEYESLDPNACIVFQNLAQETTEEEILKLLKPFGNPFSVRLVHKEKEALETRAFVQFDKLETAKLVIDELNGVQIRGKNIQLELANRKNKVFIKAKYHENAMEELKQTLQEWKYEESETPEISSDKLYFIALLKFENKETAISFLNDFSANPSKYPLILNAVEKANLKSLKTDFTSENSSLFCRVSHFNESTDFEQFKVELETQFGQIAGLKVV